MAEVNDQRTDTEASPGVRTPAFVERMAEVNDQRTDTEASPGLEPRPSLSEAPGWSSMPWAPRVAGVRTPAFVERSWSPCRTPRPGRASPGLEPRPSLSAPESLRVLGQSYASPGLEPRPSLSEGGGERHGRGRDRVAGVRTPAFVERATRSPVPCSDRGVAGVRTPAFVERDCR